MLVFACSFTATSKHGTIILYIVLCDILFNIRACYCIVLNHLQRLIPSVVSLVYCTPCPLVSCDLPYTVIQLLWLVTFPLTTPVIMLSNCRETFLITLLLINRTNALLFVELYKLLFGSVYCSVQHAIVGHANIFWGET